eukprot:gene3619-2556_t
MEAAANQLLILNYLASPGYGATGEEAETAQAILRYACGARNASKRSVELLHLLQGALSRLLQRTVVQVRCRHTIRESLRKSARGFQLTIFLFCFLVLLFFSLMVGIQFYSSGTRRSFSPCHGVKKAHPATERASDAEVCILQPYLKPALDTRNNIFGAAVAGKFNSCFSFFFALSFLLCLCLRWSRHWVRDQRELHLYCTRCGATSSAPPVMADKAGLVAREDNSSAFPTCMIYTGCVGGWVHVHVQMLLRMCNSALHIIKIRASRVALLQPLRYVIQFERGKKLPLCITEIV